MKRCFLVATILVAGTQATALAQTPGAHASAPAVDAKTPGDCTKTLGDWRTAQLAPQIAALRAATTDSARAGAMRTYQSVYTGVNAEAMRSAKQCAEKFSVDRVPSAQLIELVGLYAFTGDTVNRRRASERALSATDLPPRQNGMAMLLLLNQEISRAGSYFGILDGAEGVMSRVDGLPDSLADIKMIGHQTLLSRYEYLDVNEGLRHHATRLIELGRHATQTSSELSPQSVDMLHNAMLAGYQSLARSAADRLQPDSALMILDNAEKELGKEKAAPRFADFRNRYALLGTRAAPITGAWWINSPPSPAPVRPGDGKVRLVEFTAHWCVPCKNSYPGLRELADRFQGQDFEGVMVTSLYGYVGDRRNLTPEQEVDADRDYFAKEHSLPFRMAINPQPKSRAMPSVDADYRVGGIPQIVILDKRGIIRQIVTGWDQGNTKRIGDLIERLLKEPAA